MRDVTRFEVTVKVTILATDADDAREYIEDVLERELDLEVRVTAATEVQGSHKNG